jgi:hypothetical protein
VGLLSRVLVALLATLVLLPAMPKPASAVEMASSLGLSATYDVTATLKWSKSKLIVASTALVTNDTEQAVEAVTFSLLPAKLGRMTLKGVTVGELPATAHVSGQTVSVTLPTPLPPTKQVAVTIRYTALFRSTAGNSQWLFMKANGIATAYRWIPWLSKKIAFKRPNFGDPFVTAVSRDVRVRLTTDRSMKFATSGMRTGGSGLTQTFEAHNVRDFNFTASPFYLTRSATWEGVRVTVYYRNLPSAKLLEWTIAALKRFSNKVGRYPYATLSVAETPGGHGMESPAMYWIPQTTPSGNRRFIVTHEMAHQWFYGVVGNNQAEQPFTDEAMAEFLTRDFLGHRASRCPLATLDSTVYEYTDTCYYEVIYVQGGSYLNAYRLRVGDSAFWAGVQNYYKTYGYRITGIRQLLDILDEAAPPELAGGHAERFPRTYVPV